MYFEKKEGEFQKKWNIWKDEESLSSMCNIDDKIHRLKVYSLGWGSTIITDKTHMWNIVKREILAQRKYSNLHNPITTESYQSTTSKLKQDISIDQFFERHEIIDKGVYEELASILKREMRHASDSNFMFGLPIKPHQ